MKPGFASQPETHFSWLRTRLSVERTLMSVIRTSTTLIGFGFTIFTFFHGLSDADNVNPARFPRLPTLFSLSMVAAGVVILLVSLKAFREAFAHLWSPEFSDISGLSDQPRLGAMYYAAIFLCCVGIAVCVIMVWRLASNI